MSGDGQESAATAGRIVEEALGWVGTPYRHQGSRRQVGCDCLSLVRGVWRAVYGREPESPSAYAPDWAEAGGADLLLDAARRHCVERPPGEPEAGDLILFRWRDHLPVKHAGIALGSTRFVHAYEGCAVVISTLVPQWRKRIVARFAFPDPQT